MLGEDGMIEAIVASERNVAHRIIEEFMLLANETVAGHLVADDVPSLHRVHEAPDAKKVMDFEAFIAPLGYGLAATGHALRPRHFQRLIDRMNGTPEERPIAALMLRTMQKARYDAEASAISAWRPSNTPTSPRPSAAIPISSSTACCASPGRARCRMAPARSSTRRCR